MTKKVIGIDIGGTSIKFALIDVWGSILKKWSIPTNINDSGNQITTEIINSIKQETSKLLYTEIIGCGVGVPGPVSIDGKCVLRAVNLGWENLPLKAMMENSLNIPVKLLNDANAAALGELWKGAAKEKDSLLFITLGTGVGGGIVINDRIVNGAHSSGGEIGHIPVFSEENRKCGCGNVNCLETFASASGLVQTYVNTHEEKISKKEITAKKIIEMIGEDNQAAKYSFRILIKHLGMAISAVMNSIDVEEVVIGGGLSEAGITLLKPLQEEIELHIFPQIRSNLEISKAQLGNEAGVYGAVYHFLKEEQK